MPRSRRPAVAAAAVLLVLQSHAVLCTGANPTTGHSAPQEADGPGCRGVSWSVPHLDPGTSAALPLGSAAALSLTCVGGALPWPAGTFSVTLQAAGGALRHNVTGWFTDQASMRSAMGQPVLSTFMAPPHTAASTHWQLVLTRTAGAAAGAATPPGTLHIAAVLDFTPTHHTTSTPASLFGLHAAPPATALTPPPPSVPGWCPATPQQPCKAGCSPNGTLPLTDCSWYTGNGSAWLPPTYGMAAGCVCTLAHAPFAQAPTAACVRTALHEGHLTNVYFNASTKAALARLKTAQCQRDPSLPGGMKCPAAYYAALAHTGFLHTVYRMHQDAYAACCCPGHVAGEWAWSLVVFGGVFSEALAALCPLEVDMVECFGNCGCQGW